MESDFLATMFPFFPAVFPAMDPTIPYEAPWQPLQSIFILAGSLDWALELIFPLALLQQYSQWKVSGGHSEIPHRETGQPIDQIAPAERLKASLERIPLK
jgi:hypothetical protein